MQEQDRQKLRGQGRGAGGPKGQEPGLQDGNGADGKKKPGGETGGSGKAEMGHKAQPIGFRENL